MEECDAMSKSRKPRRQANSAPAGRRRVFPILAGVAVLVGLVAAGAWWWRQSQSAGNLTAFQKLEGRWQRGDGGYVLDIKTAAADGTLSAVYLNPRPINVARAEASIEGGTLKVFIELRDVNYPGSTYRLTYNSTGDRLLGTYFQATLRETYEVEFGRINP
jgi:hypothetical protein